MSNKIEQRHAALAKSGKAAILAATPQPISLGGTRHEESYANESLYHIWVKICGILWGAAMYAAFEPKFDSGVKSALVWLVVFVVAVVVSWLLYMRSQHNGDSLFSLARRTAIIFSDFGWKICSYGLIALVPRLARPFAEPTVIEVLNVHSTLMITLAAHLFGVLGVIAILRTQAKRERTERA